MPLFCPSRLDQSVSLLPPPPSSSVFLLPPYDLPAASPSSPPAHLLTARCPAWLAAAVPLLIDVAIRIGSRWAISRPLQQHAVLLFYLGLSCEQHSPPSHIPPTRNCPARTRPPSSASCPSTASDLILNTLAPRHHGTTAYPYLHATSANFSPCSRYRIRR